MLCLAGLHVLEKKNKDKIKKTLKPYKNVTKKKNVKKTFFVKIL